jgi:hypothetical protein
MLAAVVLTAAVPAFAQTSPPADGDEAEGEWEEVAPGEGAGAVEGEWDDATPAERDAAEGEWEEVAPGEGDATEGEWEEGPADGAASETDAPSVDDKAQPVAGPTEAAPTEVEGTKAEGTAPATDDAAPTEAQDDITIKNAGDVPIAEVGEQPDAAVQGERPTRRVGEAFPLTRREPLLGQWGFEVDIHYGLVGTGPTRLTNDVRFGIFDWWEIRTSFAPYPAALMSRFKIGSQQGLLGALILDGGLASLDAGVRLVEDEGESQVGPRAHFEGGLAYARALGPSFSVYASGRFRYRASPLDDDAQNVIAFDAHFTYDVLNNLAFTLGLGYSEVIGTPVREVAVNMAEVDRPGMAHFLLRDDGWSRAVTVPIAITYGRVDSFDVDLFITPRVYPQFDVVFGAGIRWRIAEIFNTKKLVGVDTDLFDTSPR